MEERKEFNRCLYCFAEKEAPGPCPACGYEDGLCDFPTWCLPMGTILRGRYLIGQVLSSTETEICYLCWDFLRQQKLQVVEYFPRDLVTRDSTHGPDVICIPGQEEAVEAGKERFFQKAKLFYNCVSRVEQIYMDFMVRNHTCYYVRTHRDDHPAET